MGKNRIVLIFLIFLFLSMILSPLSVRLSELNIIGRFDTIGHNPIFFWLPMDSVAWGGKIITLGRPLLPVIFSGMIAYHDINSSLLQDQLVREGRKKYYLKLYTTSFVFSFVIIFLALILNSIVTHLLFTNATVTDAVAQVLPQKGTFGSYIYQVSPIFYEFFYNVLIALAFGLMTNFVSSLQLILGKKNIYIAWLFPVALLYLIAYPFEKISSLYPYNLFLIIQPIALAIVDVKITWRHLIVSIVFWALLNGFLFLLGYRLRRDVFR